MTLSHHTFWLRDRAQAYTAIGTYDGAVRRLESGYPGADWRHTAVRAARVRDLRPGAVDCVAVEELAHDARYWDLRRTYGDASIQVLRYLRSVAGAQ